MSAKNILLVLTGGTICSFTNRSGEQSSDTKKAEALIIKNFREGSSKFRGEEYVSFDPRFPLDVLSENMTLVHWDALLRALKSYDFSRYDGVIILHGTDTLAYTASMLSLVLSGLCVPVIMVSSQLALYMSGANGNANFKAAVELIVNGIKPNVYAVYRNEEPEGDRMYLHYGAHLMQCANRSDNFYSKDMVAISTDNAVFEGREWLGKSPILYDEKLDLLSSKVLKIQPYVGLDYSLISLDGVCAVVHGTYHSSSVATNTDFGSCDNSNCSIRHLKALCDNRVPQIPVFIEPHVKTTYETTGDALREGILPIGGITSEMAYVKVVVGCALGLRGEELYNYVKTNVNNEFLY